ncbi:ATP-grasp domain-containing protein [Ancylobacter sp. 6x-1]|uniref:ATP-grasp domain-containing protein n=1 Tax=Ancylobacter crimeensis TaxID=2579147 RepID=A0ABT0D8L9_9HYPH|nr:ATP-grasp domain-containing protein [Ancylobacter crimeensis]
MTGGGFEGADLPVDLIAEATLMRDALIGDLEDLPGVRVVTTHDSRLPPPPRGESSVVEAGIPAREKWKELSGQAHCCWPIAPETGGELATLAALMRRANPRVIACDTATLDICASKHATSRALAAAGIRVVTSWRPDEVPADATGPFVVKPDDGAGSVDTFVIANRPSSSLTGAVVQPYVQGAPRSLTLLCQSGRAHVLAVNHQHVVRSDDRLLFHGVTVGAEPVTDELFALAKRIYSALPGLHGLVGVDFIASREGPMVIEINPRLTTSYAGLRPALAINPVAFIGELIRDGVVPDLPYLPIATPFEVRL